MKDNVRVIGCVLLLLLFSAVIVFSQTGGVSNHIRYGSSFLSGARQNDLFFKTGTSSGLYVCLQTTCSSSASDWLLVGGNISLLARPCEITITGSGTSGLLQDTDDELGKCKNMTGNALTVQSVYCWSDTGSPSIMVSQAGGADILTANITAGTFSSPGSGSLSGTPTISSNGGLDFKVVSAGGAAHEVTCSVGRTL